MWRATIIFLSVLVLSSTVFAQEKTWGGSGEEFLRYSYEGALYDAVDREFKAQRRFEARCSVYRNIHEASRAAGVKLRALNKKLEMLQLRKAAEIDDTTKTRRRLVKAEKEAERAIARAAKRAEIARLVRIYLANETQLKTERAEQAAFKALAKARKRLETAVEAVSETENTPYYSMARFQAIEAKAALSIAEVAVAAKKQAAMEAVALAELVNQPPTNHDLPDDEAGIKAAIVIARQRYQEARRIAQPYRETFCSEDYEYGCYPLVRGDPHPLPLGECSL